MQQSKIKYYPIDAYYDYKSDKLFYIIIKIDLIKNTKEKITGFKENPKYKINVAPYTSKIQYLLPISQRSEEIELTYKEYNSLKYKLKNKYNNVSNKLSKKYSDILQNKDVYDDFKIETKFLQNEIFTYDDDYLNIIEDGIWDIEVYHEDKEFPEPKEAKYPINSITTIDKYNTLDIFFLTNDQHHDLENFDNKLYDSIKKEYGDTFKYNIHLFNNESDLLINFSEFIKKFHVLIGWNSLNFDTLYYYNRCKKLNLEKYFYASFGEIFETLNIVECKNGVIENTYYTTNILSLNYIDLIKFYENVNYPSYALNRIAKHVLKKNTHVITSKIEIANLNIEYLQNPINFITYNIGDVLLNKFIDDVLLCSKILFKQKMKVRGFGAAILSLNNILDSYLSYFAKKNNLMCISSVKTINYYSKKIWDIYKEINYLHPDRLKLIKNIRKDNKTFSIFITDDELKELDQKLYNDLDESNVVNNKNILSKSEYPFIWENENNEVKYPGAYVKNPTKGIYKNIIDLDASSLYPSCIYATNNSCDTWAYQIPENLALLYLYEKENFYNFIYTITEKLIKIYDVENDRIIPLTGNEFIKFINYVIKTKELILVETGTMFYPAHIKEGFYRKMLKVPISDRKKSKKEMEQKIKKYGYATTDPEIINLNISQLTDKKTSNSLYGFIGYSKSRIFNILLATSITIFGQFLIRSTGMNTDEIIKKMN